MTPPPATADRAVRWALYRRFAGSGRAPRIAEIAAAVGVTADEVRACYRRLAAERLLVLEPDGESIRMAPPFSGVPTQHRVLVAGRSYYANCAWDALGVVAALGGEGEVVSRCEQSRAPLRIRVTAGGPEPVPCVVHFAVPAARWWDDIVFT